MIYLYTGDPGVNRCPIDIFEHLDIYYIPPQCNIYLYIVTSARMSSESISDDAYKNMSPIGNSTLNITLQYFKLLC